MLSTRTLITLLPFVLQAQAVVSGSGTTTRYWDCCKPSCAWPGKANLLAGSSPVATCGITNSVLADANSQSGCNGGGAYQCSNESPWAVSDDLAYGYAAVNIAGGNEASWCCACYELTFKTGAVAGKKMIVQATNTGGDLAGNQFDISMPGGGVGIFNGCTQQWGAPSSGWGAQYGGIADRSSCDGFPAALKAGCQWRFDWFGGSDNPTVDFKQVACPAALTKNTGCVRADDGSLPAPAPVSSSAPIVVRPSSTAVVVKPTSTPVVVKPSSTPVVVAPVSSSTALAVKPVSTSPAVVAPVSSSPAVVAPVPTTAPGGVFIPVSSSVAVAPVASSSTVKAVVPTTPTTIAPTVTPTPAEEEDDDTCEL